MMMTLMTNPVIWRRKKKEETICINLKKGRCHFGISERAPTRTGGQER